MKMFAFCSFNRTHILAAETMKILGKKPKNVVKLVTFYHFRTIGVYSNTLEACKRSLIKMRRAAPVTILIILAMLMNITVFGQKNRAVGGGITIKDTAGDQPVKFQTAEAFSDGRGAWLKWTMETETRNFGFYIYRLDGKDRQLVNTSLVPGSSARLGNQAFSGTAYSYFDPSGGLDTTYVIESLALSGSIYSSSQIDVTAISDMAALTGYSSEFMTNERAKATDVISTDRPGDGSALRPKLTARQAKQNLAMQQMVSAQEGAKLAVKKDGMYMVTRADLENLGGFDVNSNPANWQLYLNGVQQAINVGGVGDYIEFYGKGRDEIESDTNIYYLIVGAGPGLRMGSRFVPPIPALPSENFQYSANRRWRTSYINTILNGDDTNFFGPGIGTAGPTTVFFNLFGIDVSNRRNNFRVEIQGFSITPHSVNIKLNGLNLPAVTGSNQAVFSRSYTVSPGFLREGVNTLELTGTVEGEANLMRAVTVDYRRKYIAEQNQLGYLNENFREVDIHGFSSANIRVFDMTDDSSPVLLNGLSTQQNGATFSIHVPQYRSRIMLGVEDSGRLQPASITHNAPSDLSSASNSGQLIILSYKDWMTQAEAWADYRRAHDGVTVKVVNIEDVFDEFNFGSKSSAAITAFLNLARTQWTTPPQYILLLGDASYDPRNFEGNGDFDFVSSKIVSTLYSEVPSDDSLVDFNHDGLAEISIGRVPGRTPAAIATALARVQNYEQPSFQTLSRGALFAYDDPIGFDFQAMSERIAAQLPQGTPIVYVGRSDPNAAAVLLNYLNSGKYTANYAGHGTVGNWAVATFFGNTSVPLLRNNDNLTIFTMLTCLNGYFINPTSPVSLAENLMSAQWTDTGSVTHQTGGIAVWASTGLTTPDVQEEMATRFYFKIGSNTPPVLTRMGDLVRDAKGILVAGEDVRSSWVLIGDPMLQVRQPVP